MIPGGEARGPVRRREGAGTSLCRGWQVGARGAVLDLLLVWTRPTDATLKLAFSAFMLPKTLAAAWSARRAVRGLHDAEAPRGT